MSSSATRSGRACAIAPRAPGGIAARRRQIAPAPPPSSDGSGPAVQHRLEHLRQQVGPRAVDVHPDRGGDDDVGSRRAAPRARARRRRRPARRRRSSALRSSAPSRAAGAAASWERSQNWCPARCAALNVSQARSYAIASQQLDGGIGDAGRRGDELGAQREQLAGGGPAEDLRGVRALAVAAGQLRPGRARQRPARQHDAVAKAPAADVRPAPVLRRAALVGVDRQRAQAGAREALPDRGRRREGGHVARALGGGVPLEGIEETVVGELDAAVERVEGAGREMVGRRVERDPPAAVDERGEHGQAPGREHPLDDGDARRVELQDADQQ